MSAKLNWGMDDLLKAIQDTLSATLSPFKALIPYSESDLVSLVHEKGIVEREDHTGEGTLIEGRVPQRFIASLSRYSIS